MKKNYANTVPLFSVSCQLRREQQRLAEDPATMVFCLCEAKEPQAFVFGLINTKLANTITQLGMFANTAYYKWVSLQASVRAMFWLPRRIVPTVLRQ